MYDESRNNECAPRWRRATDGSHSWCERIPDDELKATGMYHYWDPPRLLLQQLHNYPMQDGYPICPMNFVPCPYGYDPRDPCELTCLPPKLVNLKAVVDMSDSYLGIY